MENLVVSTFRDLQDATAALGRLKDLDLLGDITIYNHALIRKTGEKKFEILQSKGPEFEDGPLAGALGGTAIGAIGGPVGMTIGMLTGTMAGVAYAGDAEDFSNDFLQKVNAKIDVGTLAIILDVEEDNEVMINSYMETYGGTTIHRNISIEYDQFDEKQWKELNDEIDGEERALKAALDKDKATIQAKIDKLKLERKEKIAKIKEKAASRRKNIEEKINVLEQKIKAAGDNAKEKLKSQKKMLSDDLTQFNDDVAWAFSADYL